MPTMGETAFHRRGHGGERESDESLDDAAVHDAGPPELIAAFSGLGVCVIGTHDPRRAAGAWSDLMAQRHGGDDAADESPLDESAWWHAQHRWARAGRRGWELVRDRDDDTEPAMVLVGVYRE